MSMNIGSPGEDGEEQPMTEINTTPLVDVMLVLLIIFLITVPVAIQTVPLKLPTVTNIPTTTKPEIPPAVLHEQKVQASVTKAVEAYRAAHGGANPPNEAAIVSYFATPQEGADFVEMVEARKAKKKP